MGGSGGAGNTSGNVVAGQTGMIDVLGVDSIGFLAQSIAGGGGAGGMNVTGQLSLAESAAIGVGIGGRGGTGANAGNVTVTSNGLILVDGRSPTAADVPAGNPVDLSQIDPDTRFLGRGKGLVAQSIGGGGGAGGINITGLLNPRATQAIAVGVGGSGGAGGDAGHVVVTRGAVTASQITTQGVQSTGLLAQSVGGGGGDGGFNLVTSISNLGGMDNAVSASVNVGGSGGAAGNAGNTTVAHTGDIVTMGDRSIGLYAQSVGGGGGNANFNFSVPLNSGASSFNLAIGGGTGVGGTGGTVNVTHLGMIGTMGKGSHAIFAQSVGGGGGSAGMDMALDLVSENSLGITLGRLGGTGGDAGSVTVDSTGLLMTEGDDAAGIFAQSVGGGGGTSGSIGVDAAGSGGTDGEDANSLSVQVGLPGASGGVGGSVDVTAADTITTLGDRSYGILAQSIGGGGGAGASAGTFNYATSNALDVAVGGGGGPGGLGGTVGVNNSAMITTSGVNAHGVWAQSVGGGGGIGGYTYSAALNHPGSGSNGSNALTVTVGGQGGAGSNGGAVTVANTGNVLTTGDDAFGVRAQSIGGGGGEGGAVINGFLNGASGDSQNLTVLVGGAGGDGGTGGNVGVTNEGVVMTTGTSAPGIGAHSIGGSGGDAGVVFSAQIAVQDSNKNVGITIGGGGGSGGTSGDVTVLNQPGAGLGQVFTQGDDSYGIFAQSIGGGGGNGSSIIAAQFQTGMSSLSAGLTIGGAGGSGNSAGNVMVTNDGLVDTMGDRAHGVFAQSIGGGGGNGGLVISANATVGDMGTSPLLALGGFGGGGGDAGNVTVTNNGTITTRGANAHGIYAQSIGGGGGNAGVGLTVTPNVTNVVLANAIAAAVGAAAGGSSGSPGTVTVNQNGNITVTGAGSEAVKAEAISGGGGTLAFSFDGITSVPGLPGTTDTNATGRELQVAAAHGGPAVTIEDIEANPDGTVLTVDLGSDAGLVGQSGSELNVSTTGDFTTMGNSSPVMAQISVGGGGGVAMNELSFNPTDANDDFFGVDYDLGGSSGSGNGGGNVLVNHFGNLLSLGVNSPGAMALSIGGGGGRTSVTVDGRSESFGAIRFELGANGSSGEVGGSSIYVQVGNVETQGFGSPAVLQQSIGGGGGSAAFADLLTGDPNADLEATLGGNGGTGNDAGQVVTSLQGNVMTTGDVSSAFVLQSIGGGGGEVRGSRIEHAEVTIGGAGGVAGDGGSIDLDFIGNVTALGLRSHGIFAQSIGGGGGALFTDLSDVDVTVSGGGSGSGGAIDLEHFGGDIYAVGDDSFAVFAQSLGGGGGFVDGSFRDTAFGAGSGGTISVDSVGNIIADGANGNAIFLQSLGGGGGDAISLAVDGVIKGGSGDPTDAAAITLDGGAANTIAIGEASFVFALSDRVMTATSGDETISSSGFVIGNIDLDGGTNAYTNEIPGTLRSLDTIDLGGGLLTNAGLLSPGGMIRDPETPVGVAVTADSFRVTENVPQTTELNGSILVTDTSLFLVDATFRTNGEAGNGRSDLINATGTGAIDGVVTPTLLTLERALPLVIVDPVVSSADNGAMVTDTVVIDYEIQLDGLTGDGITIDLFPNVDFSIDGMNRNEAAVGDHINDILNGEGSTSLGPLFAFIGNQQSRQVVIDLVASLTTEGYAATIADALLAGESFADAMMNCEVLTRENVEVPEGGCYWIDALGRVYDREQTFEYERFESNSFQVIGGYQHPFDENWRAGLAGGVEYFDIDVGDRFDSNGVRGHLGASVSWAGERLEVEGIVNGSLAFHESDRTIGIAGNIAEGLPITIAKARSEHRVGNVNMRVGASYDVAPKDARYYIRPGGHIDGAYLWFDDDTERDVGPYGVDLDTRKQWVFSGTGSVEVGGDFDLTETVGDPIGLSPFVVTPFVRGGVQFRSDDEFSVDAKLIGAPSSSGKFRNDVSFDEVVGRVDLGVVAEFGGGMAALIGYGGAFGDQSIEQRGELRFEIEF